jgi:3-phenylpropionate/trans-cinnamate dioxygenase ferredoxin reductase component
VSKDAGVVIVGASLAGLTTAEGLRDEGYTGAITLIGAEDRLPYQRPPLSKQVLSGIWDVDKTILRDDAGLRSLGVRYLRGQQVTSADLKARTITIGSRIIPFDDLVAATGVAPRRLSNPNQVHGIHTLRTVDDLIALRRDLASDARVVVVGAGVLGCEIAAALRLAGHHVTILGRSKLPRLGQIGARLSRMVAELLRQHGIELRMGEALTQIVGRDAVSALRLSDGSVIPADVVIGAIGCVPVDEWLSGNDLDLSDGVLCDSHGAAAPHVYAVGDVARWRDMDSGEARRFEHQATAIEQARAVGRLIATGETQGPIQSFFWSELFDTRILVHGQLESDLPLTTVAGDMASGRFVVATIRDGRPTGLVGWNLPREFRIERARLLAEPREKFEFLKGTTLT